MDLSRKDNFSALGRKLSIPSSWSLEIGRPPYKNWGTGICGGPCSSASSSPLPSAYRPNRSTFTTALPTYSSYFGSAHSWPVSTADFWENKGTLLPTQLHLPDHQHHRLLHDPPRTLRFRRLPAAQLYPLLHQPPPGPAGPRLVPGFLRNSDGQYAGLIGRAGRQKEEISMCIPDIPLLHLLGLVCNHLLKKMSKW